VGADLSKEIGKGKSLTATFFAIQDWLNAGRKIVANYTMDLETINMDRLYVDKKQPLIIPRDSGMAKLMDKGQVPDEIYKVFNFLGVDEVERVEKKFNKWWFYTDSGIYVIWDSNPPDRPKFFVFMSYSQKVKIEPDDYQKLDYEVFIKAMKEGITLYDVSVIVDEAYLFADSRLSQTGFNRLFSYFQLQARKRDVDLYIVTQQFTNIDVRSRMNIDARILAANMNGIGMPKIIDMRTGKRKRLKFIAEDYYPFYDTREIPSLRPSATVINNL